MQVPTHHLDDVMIWERDFFSKVDNQIGGNGSLIHRHTFLHDFLAIEKLFDANNIALHWLINVRSVFLEHC